MASLSIPSSWSVQLHAGYGASLADSAAFERALEQAQSGAAASVDGPGGPAPTSAMQALVSPLAQIDAAAAQISAQAQAAADADMPMSPGQAALFTAKTFEFGFVTQLSITAGKGLSEGAQQLLRQQA